MNIDRLRVAKCHPVCKIFFFTTVSLAFNKPVDCVRHNVIPYGRGRMERHIRREMLKGPFVHKTGERKKIAHWDLRRRFATFALSLGLLFTGSTGAIFAQAEVRHKRREAHKRRPGKDREAHKRRPEKDRDTRKRGRVNGLGSSRERAELEREPETRKRILETEREGHIKHLEWQHENRKRDAESGREARKRYEEAKRDAIKQRREWIREESAKHSLFSRQQEKKERERFPILPKDAKQSLFLQRPETFKRNREWIREARKLR
jgi:hypothetical protein